MSRESPARWWRLVGSKAGVITLREYAKFCGPGTIAAVLGVSRTTAATRLLGVRGRDPYACGGSWLAELTTVLRDAGRVTTGNSFRTQERPRVTVARWLREHPRTAAVLATHDHVLYVRDGAVVFDNRNAGSTRCKVTEVLTLRRAE